MLVPYNYIQRTVCDRVLRPRFLLIKSSIYYTLIIVKNVLSLKLSKMPIYGNNWNHNHCFLTSDTFELELSSQRHSVCKPSYTIPKLYFKIL